MRNTIVIADMMNGDKVEGFYVIKDPTIRTASNGRAYLSGVLSDISGTIELKSWDYAGPVSECDAGKVVKIRGEVSEFKGMPQLTVSRIRLADGNDVYNLADLVPTAPVDADRCLEEIRQLISSLPDADYRSVAEKMLNRHIEQFSVIPAAKSVHHSFISGLMMHTYTMLKTAAFLAETYSEVIDRSLLISGTLLHDFAKEQEFLLSELGMVTDYSMKGQLIGHLVMGAQEIAEVAKETGMPEEKTVLLQHLVLSHHGEPEFGAAVRPMCAEAELLSYIDMIDSRMEIYAEELVNVPVGEFSSRVFSLDHKIYHHR